MLPSRRAAAAAAVAAAVAVRARAGKELEEDKQKIIIYTEVRAKKKEMTIVEGLDGAGLKLKDAAKDFAKKFACSSAVKDTASGTKEIVIQGDCLYDLTEFLQVASAQRPPSPSLPLPAAERPARRSRPDRTPRMCARRLKRASLPPPVSGRPHLVLPLVRVARVAEPVRHLEEEDLHEGGGQDFAHSLRQARVAVCRRPMSGAIEDITIGAQRSSCRKEQRDGGDDASAQQFDEQWRSAWRVVMREQERPLVLSVFFVHRHLCWLASVVGNSESAALRSSAMAGFPLFSCVPDGRHGEIGQFRGVVG